jgi:hypothetical protein
MFAGRGSWVVEIISPAAQSRETFCSVTSTLRPFSRVMVVWTAGSGSDGAEPGNVVAVRFSGIRIRCLITVLYGLPVTASMSLPATT